MPLEPLRLQLPSPLVEVDDERLGDVRLLLKRDDLISPEVPGNKWRKLRLNLEHAGELGYHTLLTFGGAYSNHLRAVAAAGAQYKLDTIGVVRGDELAAKPRNWSLAYCEQRGMRLVFMDRQTYREKHSTEVVDRLHSEHGDFFLIPEGGSNALAVRGAMDVPGEITAPYDVICCPAGTGGTLAGIAAGAPPGVHAIGFSALKGDFLTDEVQRLQAEAGLTTANWRVETRYHFGGFAKHPPQLHVFATDFEARHGVRLELTYVAKMLAGIYEMAANGEFSPGTTLVAVITGPAESGAGGT
ncbi:pyridoxal-phosphate dependent enzyme [Nocardiopsis sp. RSe5-2]|uniref:Pyridoxal-phosphate dependent enzyme n=1 Tax=Nocardiopsis endophytica TaxID=3018445 RepID=A0ABT4TZ02_9ACTN|nr:pyridoxal-phosphate dependent enzyme [Nocardiopsis endophytica]MDA2809926.1 pyridoxal-phosphate dependent enzyme [Nocardiopsis endophytica]